MRVCSTLLACAAAFSSAATAAIPDSECQALIAFYNATNGPAWTARTGWLGAVGTECQWHGVLCIQDRVISLDLSNNNLAGPLPPVNVFPRLFFLNMNGNQLTGPIPSMSGLADLTHLWMNGNRLTGPIPVLAGSPLLVQVRLGNNQLSGPIPSLAGLDDLSIFFVPNNQLSGPVPSLPVPSSCR